MASRKIEDVLGAFVRSKQKGTDSGNYQRNARLSEIVWMELDAKLFVEKMLDFL